MYSLTLKEHLKDILLAHESGLSEFELIMILQKPPYQLLSDDAFTSDLAMFQCHFILFHCLYEVQSEWQKECIGYLDIHVTCIRLLPDSDAPALKGEQALKDYYLDWNNFNNTTEEDVVELINSFWHRFAKLQPVSDGDVSLAYRLLDVAEDIDFPSLKKRYRKLLHSNHPDKGGSVEVTQEIDWAYRVLKRHLH